MARITETFESGVLLSAFTTQTGSGFYTFNIVDDPAGTHGKVLCSTNQEMDQTASNISFTFTTTAVGAVSFDYRLSSEFDWDKAYFFFDVATLNTGFNVNAPNFEPQAFAIDGGHSITPNPYSWTTSGGNWVSVSIPNVSIGTHKLTIAYAKDTGGIGNLDSLYIDNISYEGAAYVTSGLQLYLNAQGYSGNTSTWTDLSGNGNNGTLTNFDYNLSSGWNNNSLVFDGNDDYITTNINSLYVAPFTYEMYCSVDSTANGYHFFGDTTNWSTGLYLQLDMDNGNFALDVCDTQIYTWPANSNFNHHVIRVNVDSSVDYFVNGVQQARTLSPSTLYSPPIEANRLIEFGRTIAGTYIYRKMKLRLFRVYSKALTNIEITQNYNDTMGGTAPTTNNLSGSIAATSTVSGSLINAAAQSYVTNGLQLYLNAQGYSGNTSTWTDLSGNNNSVTLNNFAYTDTSGWINGSLVFDGINDYVSIPSSNELKFTNQFTICIKLKILNLAMTNRYIIDEGNGNTFSLIYGFVPNTFELWGGSIDIRSGSQVTINDNLEHIIMYTYNGSTLKGYLDGNKVIDIAKSVTLNTNNDNYIIGTYLTAYSEFSLSELMLYNRGLTDSEITQNYNAAISSSTVLLLHMNGTNGSTTFVDSSPSAKTVSVVGTPTISTAQSKFGGASAYFDANNSYLSLADSEDFNFGAGNFTIDCWIKRSVLTGGNQNLIAQTDSSSTDTQTSFYILFDSTNALAVGFNTGTTWNMVTSSNTLTDTASWHHIAMVRSGTSLVGYVDGVQWCSLSVGTNACNNSIHIVSIGSAGEYLGNVFRGYIDEFRITKGAALWTANFTPPTTETGGGATPTNNNLSGTITAASTVQSSLKVVKPLNSNITAASSITSSLKVIKPLSSNVNIVSSVQSSLKITKPLNSSINAASTVSAALTNTTNLGMSTYVNAASSVQGSLSVSKALASNIAISSSVQGGLSIIRNMGANVNGVTSVTSALTNISSSTLNGNITVASSVQAALSIAKSLSGAVNTASSVQAQLLIVKPLSGNIGVLSSVSGVVDNTTNKLLAANTVSSTSVTAGLLVSRSLAGNINSISSTQAQLNITRRLVANIVAQIITTAALRNLPPDLYAETYELYFNIVNSAEFDVNIVNKIELNLKV